MTKPKDLFNPLFKGKPVKVGKQEKAGTEQKPKSEPRKRPAPDPPEQVDFTEAMSGVKPLPGEDRKRVLKRPPSPLPDDRRGKIGRVRHGTENKQKPQAEHRIGSSRNAPEQNEFLKAMTGVKPLLEEPRHRVRPGGSRSRAAVSASDERREKTGLRGQGDGAKKGNTGSEYRAGPPDHTPEQNEFIEAMSGVEPLLNEPRQRVRPGELRSRPAVPAPDERREVIGHLRSLVKGAIELDITFSDEYIEGSVRGFNQDLMKKLKRGEFPVQDHIDLHGLTREEAEAAIKGFILRSFRLGLRCVLIIHGRGLNSPESFPVLKEGLPIWLARSPVKRMVLAFATARPYDGGTGAVYVLLRKR